MAYLLGLPDRVSTLSRHLLLRPHEGSSISHALGRDCYIGFFARRLYRFDALREASVVLLVVLTIPHAPSYSALRTEAMRRTPLRIARFRAVAASSVTCTSLIGVPLLEVTLARLVKRAGPANCGNRHGARRSVGTIACIGGSVGAVLLIADPIT